MFFSDYNFDIIIATGGFSMDQQFTIETFYEELEKHQIVLSDTQKQQFLDYAKMLAEWNEKMNLTSITDDGDIIVKHFVDSLLCVEYIKENSKIIDGLSSRMLSYLAIVIRRHMIAQGMDELCEKYNSGSMSEYEESLMAGVKRYQRLLDGVIGELRRRGLNRVEDKVKAADKDVSDYVNSGYVGLFK